MYAVFLGPEGLKTHCQKECTIIALHSPAPVKSLGYEMRWMTCSLIPWPSNWCLIKWILRKTPSTLHDIKPFDSLNDTINLKGLNNIVKVFWNQETSLSPPPGFMKKSPSRAVARKTNFLYTCCCLRDWSADIWWNQVMQYIKKLEYEKDLALSIPCDF